MAEIKLELSSVATTNGYDIQVWASAVSGSKDITSINLRIQFDPAYSNIKLSGSDPVFVLSTSASSAFPISFGDTSIPNTFIIGASAMTGKLTVSTTPVLLATASFDNVQGTNDFVGSLSSSTEIYKDDTLLTLNPLPTIDTVEAAVSQIAITDATGDISGLLNAGDTVIATVTANKAVTVDTINGTPTLKLDVGGVEKTATYASGSGSTSLLFTYTVQSGDTDANGISIGTNALSLNGGTIKDSSNSNAVITSNAVAANSSYKVDTTAPTATIALSDYNILPITDVAPTVTVTFSEAVIGFSSADDLTIGGGILAAPMSSNNGGVTWTATLNANGNGTTNVIALATTYTDLAGNTGTSSTSPSYVVDSQPPMAISMVLDKNALKVGDTSQVTITFSEAVTGLTKTDLSANTGTFSELVTTDNIIWTGTFTPTVNLEDATNVISLANTYTDVAGNAGSSRISNNFTIDTNRPTVTVTPATTILAKDGTVTITMTMSEPVTGFAFGDIKTSSKYSITDFTATSSTVYTATYTATEATNDVANELQFETAWTDAAGNQPVFGPTVNIALGDNALKIGDTSLVTMTFSEAPIGFTADDITGENGVMSGVAVKAGSNGLVYEATFTPAAGITTPVNKITIGKDWTAGGLAPVSSTDSLNYTVDTVRPAVTSIVVADAALKAGETSLVTITFSEAVSGVEVGDFTVAHGALSNLGSADGGVTWTATLTPTTNITATSNLIVLANSGVTDIAGNAGVGTTDSNNYAIDTQAPTVAITSNVHTLKSGETATISFTFSEDPGSSFIDGDITTTGGALGTLSGTGLVRTAIFTPTANFASGNASITVAGGNYTDTAGNAGGAGTTPTISIDTLAPAAPASIAESPASTDLLDSLMNYSEAVTTTFRVVLPTTGSIAVANDSIELLLGGASFTTQKKVTLSSQNITDGYVDFTVAKADLGADGAKALTSKITDIAGNVGAASSAVSFTLDTTAPTNTIKGVAVNTGGDTITATLANLLDSDQHGVKLEGQIIAGLNAIVNPANWQDIAVPITKDIVWTHGGTASDENTIVFRITDTAGNATTSTTSVSGAKATTTQTIPTSTTVVTDTPVATNDVGNVVLDVDMPVGVDVVVKEVTDSDHNTLSDKLNNSLAELTTAQKATIDTIAVSTGINNYIDLLTDAGADQAKVVVRTIEFTSTATTTAGQLVVDGSTGGNEALVIDTTNLPDDSVIDLRNVEFAIIIGDKVKVRGGAGSNIVYAGAGDQDILLGVEPDTLHGGAGNDTVASDGGDDWLYGDDGNDSVSGGADNDHLYGGTGNDMLDGGADSDTALFSGNFTDYTITFNGVSYTITDNNSIDGVDDGTDIVTNVEFFQFANGTYPQDSIIPADPYESHEGSGRPSPEAAFTGIGVLGILSWVLF